MDAEPTHGTGEGVIALFIQHRTRIEAYAYDALRGPELGGGIGSILSSDRTMVGGTEEIFAYNPMVGHVTALTDVNGATVDSDRYDAFGNIIGTPVGTSQNNRLANTKERNTVGSLALDSHGFRYYNPVTGRYISRDPLGYPNGLNNYLYVRNNPINRIDPLGLWEKQGDGTAKVQKKDTVYGLWKQLGGSKGTGMGWGDFEKNVQKLNKGLDFKKLKEGQTVRYEAEEAAAGEWDSADAAGESPEGPNSEAAIGIGSGVAVVAGNAIDAARGRELYNELVSKLDPNDSASRGKIKEFVRSLKPHEVNDAIRAMRPSTGAKPGSTRSANKSNAAVVDA